MRTHTLLRLLRSLLKSSQDPHPTIARKAGDPCNIAANGLDKVQEKVDEAAAAYDQVEAIVRTVSVRTDAAKSLWATIVGTIWQSVWAVISFLIGLPKEVWLVVAVIVAAILMFYLYRQLALGRIREKDERGHKL